MTDLGAMDWKALFDALYPGFFEQPSIRALPQDGSWEEMALSLPGFSGKDLAIPVPDGVSFGIYKGGLQPLRAEVRRVDESWPDLNKTDEVLVDERPRGELLPAGGHGNLQGPSRRGAGLRGHAAGIPQAGHRAQDGAKRHGAAGGGGL